MYINRSHVRKAILSLAAVMTAMVILTGCSEPLNLSLNQPTTVKTTTTFQTKDSVKTTEVKRGDISVSITSVGYYQPLNAVNVSLKDSSGTLKNITVVPGEEVKAGQVVAEIDTMDTLTQIRQLEIGMDKWKIRLQQDEQKVEATKLDIQQAVVEVDLAERRNKVEDTQITRVALENAKLKYAQAVSTNKDAQLSKNMTAVEMKMDEAKLAELRGRAARNKIFSPINGIVVFTDKLSQSEKIDNGRVLVRIAEPKDMVFWMVASETLFGKYFKNGVLTIQGEKYDVDYYIPQSSDQLIQSTNINSSDALAKNRVYLKFSGKIPNVRLNESFNASLEVKKDNVLLIPKSVVRIDNGKTKVDVLKGEEVETVEVQLGVEKDNMLEVLEGLKEGDKVVLR